MNRPGAGRSLISSPGMVTFVTDTPCFDAGNGIVPIDAMVGDGNGHGTACVVTKLPVMFTSVRSTGGLYIDFMR